MEGLIYSVILCAVALPIMIWVSHPLELRPFRWIRIALTFPALIIAASMLARQMNSRGEAIGGVTTYGFCFLIVALIWRGNISWHLGNSFSNFLYGGGRGGGGHRPDFREARALIKEEEFEKAIAALIEQLEKDPCNYEGRLLAAEVCEDLTQFDQAIQHLDHLLASPNLMPAQRECAINARRRFEILKLAAPKSS